MSLRRGDNDAKLAAGALIYGIDLFLQVLAVSLIGGLIIILVACFIAAFWGA